MDNFLKFDKIQCTAIQKSLNQGCGTVCLTNHFNPYHFQFQPITKYSWAGGNYGGGINALIAVNASCIACEEIL